MALYDDVNDNDNDIQKDNENGIGNDNAGDNDVTITSHPVTSRHLPSCPVTSRVSTCSSVRSRPYPVCVYMYVRMCGRAVVHGGVFTYVR